MNWKEVENIILNEIEAALGKDLRLTIQNLPVRKKRIAMLAVICVKDEELKQMILDIQSSTRVSQLDDIIRRIRKYNPIGSIEKDLYGEIFTKFWLINEMLDKLPENVWTNPYLRWADLCNGVGNFMVVIIQRLMIGLEKWQPDENKRYKHIVEKMIFVAELQEKNMFLWMVSIDPYSEYNLNIYCGSSINNPDFDDHMKNVWKISDFDVIVGNPPYHKKIEGNNINKPIWHFFVDKYLDLLKKDGYMVLVHPSGWRSVKTFKDIKEKMLSNDIIFLKMNSFKDGQEVFNAAINFDYYLLQKSNNDIKTLVICEDKSQIEIKISKLGVIPSENINEILSLFAKEDEDKVNIIANSSYHHTRDHVSKNKTSEFKYPCIYTVKSPDKGNLPTYYWSNTNNKGHFGVSKVIFGNGASGVITDPNGEYGLTQFAYAIVDDIENLENIKTALQSEKFIKNIMLFKNSLGDKYNRKLLNNFRKDFWKEFITNDN